MDSRRIIMFDLKLFATLDNRKFAAAVRFFSDKKRALLVTRFWDYVANAIARTYETGDVTHVNKAAGAAELCGYGVAFRKFAVPVIPFKYSMPDRGFEGTIQKGKRNTLDQLNEDGVIKWEAELHRRLGDDAAAKKETKPVDYDKRVASAIKAALKHGITPAHLKKVVSETISENITTVGDKKAAKKAA